MRKQTKVNLILVRRQSVCPARWVAWSRSSVPQGGKSRDGASVQQDGVVWSRASVPQGGKSSDGASVQQDGVAWSRASVPQGGKFRDRASVQQDGVAWNRASVLRGRGPDIEHLSSKMG